MTWPAPTAGRIMQAGLSQSRLLNIAGTLFALTIACYVLIPIIIAVVMSFNDGNMLRFPIREWSLKWYRDFFISPQFVDALVNSLVIALGTTLVATLFGTAAAWSIVRHRVAGCRLFSVLIMFPLFMPGVVLGLGLAITFGNVQLFGHDLFGSRLLVILAHSLWGVPLVYMLMEPAFRSLDSAMLEAAADLGARPGVTFIEIVLPEVSTAVLSGALFSFVVSINEFYMALFLTTRDTQTLPVLMWLSLRSAGSPRLAVAAVVLLSAVIISLMLIMVISRRRVRIP